MKVELEARCTRKAMEKTEKRKKQKKTLIHKQIHTNNEMPKFNTTQYRNSIVIDITLHVLVN